MVVAADPSAALLPTRWMGGGSGGGDDGSSSDSGGDDVRGGSRADQQRQRGAGAPALPPPPSQQAQAGDPAAQLAHGRLLAAGGLWTVEAGRWLRRAAAQGGTRGVAQYELAGWLEANGGSDGAAHGEAIRWLRKASQAGHAAAAASLAAKTAGLRTALRGNVMLVQMGGGGDGCGLRGDALKAAAVPIAPLPFPSCARTLPSSLSWAICRSVKQPFLHRADSLQPPTRVAHDPHRRAARI